MSKPFVGLIAFVIITRDGGRYNGRLSASVSVKVFIFSPKRSFVISYRSSDGGRYNGRLSASVSVKVFVFSLVRKMLIRLEVDDGLSRECGRQIVSFVLLKRKDLVIRKTLQSPTGWH